jgi:cAMP phosphodiesterase
MKIKLLPSSIGSGARHQALTTFLVNGCLAVDGGSIGLALAPEEMASFRHIVITHSHSDHTASLPIFIAEAFTSLTEPVTVYGTRAVVSALRDFVFNDLVWPDFEKIPLAGGGGPSLRFHTIEPLQPARIAGLKVTPIPVNHVVETMGLLVEDETVSVLFTSDTYTTDEIWRAANRCERLKAVFVDVSYPNELEELAAASRHFTPQTLASDLKKLKRDARVLAVHIKPSNREQVVRQLAQLEAPPVSVAEIGREYEW